MQIREVSGSKKTTIVREFFEGYLSDPATKFVMSPDEARALGFESVTLACYDHQGVVGAINYTAPVEEIGRFLSQGHQVAAAELSNNVRMVYNLAVRNDQRDSGIGGELLAAAEHHARQAEVSVLLGVAMSDTGELDSLVRFYERHGYVVKPAETPVEIVLPQARTKMYLPLDGDKVRWFYKWIGPGTGSEFIR